MEKINESVLIAENNLNSFNYFIKILNNEVNQFYFTDKTVETIKEIIKENIEIEQYNNTLFKKAFGDISSLFSNHYYKENYESIQKIALKFKNFFIEQNIYMFFPNCLFETKNYELANLFFKEYFSFYFNYFINNFSTENFLTDIKNIFTLLKEKEQNNTKLGKIITSALISTLNNFSLILEDREFTKELIEYNRNNTNNLTNYFFPILTPTIKRN